MNPCLIEINLNCAKSILACVTSHDPESNVSWSFILQVGHPCRTGKRVEDQLALQFAVGWWATCNNPLS